MSEREPHSTVHFVGHDADGNITHTASGPWMSVSLNLDDRCGAWVEHDGSFPVHPEHHHVKGGKILERGAPTDPRMPALRIHARGA